MIEIESWLSQPLFANRVAALWPCSATLVFWLGSKCHLGGEPRESTLTRVRPAFLPKRKWQKSSWFKWHLVMTRQGQHLFPVWMQSSGVCSDFSPVVECCHRSWLSISQDGCSAFCELPNTLFKSFFPVYRKQRGFCYLQLWTLIHPSTLFFPHIVQMMKCFFITYCIRWLTVKPGILCILLISINPVPRTVLYYANTYPWPSWKKVNIISVMRVKS